ncbi:MAG: biopolymer transporter ExbD [Pseudomonadota bacterium]
MALRRQEYEDEDTDVNLTPMLDVVFIMLIFFIVTATFVKIPGAEVEKVDADNVGALRSPIIVAIDSASNIWIDRNEVKPREVYAIMQEMIEDNPGAKAMIQVDAASENGPLLELMESMQAAGIQKIDVVTAPTS